MKSSVKQLHESFRPETYKLVLEPDYSRQKFSGHVTILGIKTGPVSKRLTFHQVGLKFKAAKLTYYDKKDEYEINVIRINKQDKANEVRIHSRDNLKSGRYSVEMSFSGKINKNMYGIYPCFYKDGKTTKELIATQFESHHAREVFPCIDEPAAKATFELTLATPQDSVAISNSKVATKTINKGKLITTFEPTPKMSTYLLAFVYGDIGYKQAITKDGVKVRAYATKDKVEYLDFALETAVKCLDFYNDYFGISYPLKKCDLVALPDFAAGAMENWGCVTFRESVLLVDPKNTSLVSKQYVALVVAHELAHQWFGNLVTMRWWTDLWLNEGFASWMEYFAVDHIFPEWQLWVQFAVDEQHAALSLDALENTHPVEVIVRNPEEINTIFDSISYSKGASIINMLHKFIGARDFKAGLRYYLEKNKYANTDTIDLWKAMQDISKKPIKDFMHKWTATPGYPLVMADVNGSEVILTQDRFFTNPKHRIIDDNVWPVALITNSDQLPELLTTKHKSYKAKTNNLLLNMGQSGFYRVVYNATHCEVLGRQILRGRLEPLDRLGLLSDMFEASKADKFDTVEALHFLSYYVNEDNFAVWDVIASAIGNLRLVMDDDELRQNLKPYVRDLLKTQLKRLGIQRKKTDTHFDQLLRPMLFGMAAAADEKRIVDYCLKLFSEIKSAADISSDLKSTSSRQTIKQNVRIDPDLRSTVFCTAARFGGQKEFDKLLKLHNSTTMSEVRSSLSAALTAFEKPEIISQALDLITSEWVRPQDVTEWIIYSFMNRHAKKMTWEWLKMHWDWLGETLGADWSYYRMPVYAGRVFSNEEFLDEFKAFFEPKLSLPFERTYKQAVEIIKFQSAWRNKALAPVKNFFKQQLPD